MTIWGQRSGTCSFAKCKQAVPKAKDSVPTAACSKGEGQCPDRCMFQRQRTDSRPLHVPKAKDRLPTAACSKSKGQCPDRCMFQRRRTVSGLLHAVTDRNSELGIALFTHRSWQPQISGCHTTWSARPPPTAHSHPACRADSCHSP